MTDRIKLILDDTLSGRAYANPVHITYDRMDMFLTDHEKNAKRIYEYVVAQEPYLREYSAFTGLFNFDGTVPGDAMSMLGSNLWGKDGIGALFYCKPVDRLTTFEWQHATADYNAVIRKGVKGLIAEIEASKKVHADDEGKVQYLDALKKVAEAMIAWAHKCSRLSLEMAQKTENEEYKQNLLLLSESLMKVPENEATSFYEAVLSIYVLFSYDPDSLGTLDRTLQSFYDADINSRKITRATPDGRYDGEMLKFGLGQSGGNDRNGLTALLSSVAKCDKYHLMNGSSVTNIYLEESLIKNDESFEKIARLLDAYFDMGGVHFQLNYLSKADLIEAKTQPEKHQNLRVRVSGFSDYFTRLADSVQDDIIQRTEHDG